MQDKVCVRPCLGEGILAKDCKKKFKTTKYRRLCERCTALLRRRQAESNWDLDAMYKLYNPRKPEGRSFTMNQGGGE